MAAALSSAADSALHATDERASFQRLTRLLVCGGIALLREVFDSIHPPANLPTVLGNHKAQLQKLRKRNVINQFEWTLLYPSPGVYGNSTEFDITLLFKLFRNICNLIPPITGWDNLPNSTDLRLEADLVRIKFYRNEVYGHSKNMEISDDQFVTIWGEISEALLRIAGSLSVAKKDEWKKSIDTFLCDPLTLDSAQSLKELQSWYKKDMDLKDIMEMVDMKQEQTNTKLAENYTKLEQKVDSLIDMVTEIKSKQCESFDKDNVDIWHVILSFKKSFNLLVEYLKIKLGVDVQDSRLGSLVVTVSCNSLQVLEGLWEDYQSGHLNEMIQETLVTTEVLKELGLSELKLKTIISEEEYRACKEQLTQGLGETNLLNIII